MSQIIIIDFFAQESNAYTKQQVAERGQRLYQHAGSFGKITQWHPPMPNIWSGPHRVVKDQWWSIAASRCTAICLCNQKHIAFLDDRSVLMPGWLDCIQKAIKGNYAVAGAYEKRTGMTVENGVIKHAGIVAGVDTRETYVAQNKITPPYDCPGSWFFGCNYALPLEWLLKIGGMDQTCDGLGIEDVVTGLQLENNGYRIKYDPRSRMIEDRTPGEIGPVMRREDRGKSPNDLSHRLLDMLKDRKSALNYWNPTFDIRAVRNQVLAGKPFPIPEKKDYRHFWDNTPLSEWT